MSSPSKTSPSNYTTSLYNGQGRRQSPPASMSLLNAAQESHLPVQPPSTSLVSCLVFSPAQRADLHPPSRLPSNATTKPMSRENLRAVLSDAMAIIEGDLDLFDEDDFAPMQRRCFQGGNSGRAAQ